MIRSGSSPPNPTMNGVAEGRPEADPDGLRPSDDPGRVEAGVDDPHDDVSAGLGRHAHQAAGGDAVKGVDERGLTADQASPQPPQMAIELARLDEPRQGPLFDDPGPPALRGDERRVPLDVGLRDDEVAEARPGVEVALEATDVEDATERVLRRERRWWWTLEPELAVTVVLDDPDRPPEAGQQLAPALRRERPTQDRAPGGRHQHEDVEADRRSQ